MLLIAVNLNAKFLLVGELVWWKRVERVIA